MSSPKRYDRIAFVASPGAEAQAALAQLTALYGNHDPDDADIVVALGGDGLMLQTLHRHMRSDKPIYGMHRGTVGFLMNEFSTVDLHARLAAARDTVIHPLLMRATDVHGAVHLHHAINEVSLFRQTHQAARLRILIDEQRADGRADRRRHHGGDTGRIDRLQSVGAGTDPADQRGAAGADPDQRVPAAALARRPAAQHRLCRHRGARGRQAPGRGGRRPRRGARRPPGRGACPTRPSRCGCCSTPATAWKSAS